MESRWNQPTFLHCFSAGIVSQVAKLTTPTTARLLPSHRKGSYLLPFRGQQAPDLQRHSMHPYLLWGFPLCSCACWLAQSCLAGISWPHHDQWVQPNGSPPLALLSLSWEQNPLQPAFQSSIGVLHSYRDGDRFTPSAPFLQQPHATYGVHHGELLIFPTPGSMALSSNRDIHEQGGDVSNLLWDWFGLPGMVKCLQDLKGSGLCCNLSVEPTGQDN